MLFSIALHHTGYRHRSTLWNAGSVSIRYRVVHDRVVHDRAVHDRVVHDRCGMYGT